MPFCWIDKFEITVWGGYHCVNFPYISWGKQRAGLMSAYEPKFSSLARTVYSYLIFFIQFFLLLLKSTWETDVDPIMCLADNLSSSFCLRLLTTLTRFSNRHYCWSGGHHVCLQMYTWLATIWERWRWHQRDKRCLSPRPIHFGCFKTKTKTHHQTNNKVVFVTLEAFDAINHRLAYIYHLFFWLFK